MKWAVDRKRHEAMSPQGYRITWADNRHGTWFNGYAPSGKCIEASYDQRKVKIACTRHHERGAPQLDLSPQPSAA